MRPARLVADRSGPRRPAAAEPGRPTGGSASARLPAALLDVGHDLVARPRSFGQQRKDRGAHVAPGRLLPPRPARAAGATRPSGAPRSARPSGTAGTATPAAALPPARARAAEERGPVLPETAAPRGCPRGRRFPRGQAPHRRQTPARRARGGLACPCSPGWPGPPCAWWPRPNSSPGPGREVLVGTSPLVLPGTRAAEWAVPAGPAERPVTRRAVSGTASAHAAPHRCYGAVSARDRWPRTAPHRNRPPLCETTHRASTRQS